MRVMEVREPGGALTLSERERPEPGPGEVRIAVGACGVCHSDAFVKLGMFRGIPYPRVPGHEVAGTIDAVGEGVRVWRVGDRVGVGWHGGHCFQCEPCRRGHFINCERAKITGISHDGGYGEFMISPWEAVARLPEGLAFVDAGPLLCAGVTTYNSLRNSGARPGDTVAIQGIGGLGHLAIQYAAKMGFRTVAISRGPDKEALARQLGASVYIDAIAEDPVAVLRGLGGADLVLATAPSAEAINTMPRALTARGKLMLLAAPEGKLELSAMGLLTGKHVQGWSSGTAIDSEDTVNFSVLTGVKARIELFDLDQANEAFARMMANEARFRVVLKIG